MGQWHFKVGGATLLKIKGSKKYIIFCSDDAIEEPFLVPQETFTEQI